MVGQTNGGRDPNYQDKLILTADEFRDKPARRESKEGIKTNNKYIHGLGLEKVLSNYIL